MKRVQHIRQLPADAGVFIGLEGELIVEKDSFTLRVHDGETPGGFPLITLAVADDRYAGKETFDEFVVEVNNRLDGLENSIEDHENLAYTPSFATVAEVRALPSNTTSDKYAIFMRSQGAGHDGGGGIYYWDTDSVVDDDGFDFLAPDDDEDGRWIRMFPSAYFTRAMGNIGSLRTDAQLGIANRNGGHTLFAIDILDPDEEGAIAVSSYYDDDSPSERAAIYFRNRDESLQAVPPGSPEAPNSIVNSTFIAGLHLIGQVAGVSTDNIAWQFYSHNAGRMLIGPTVGVNIHNPPPPANVLDVYPYLGVRAGMVVGPIVDDSDYTMNAGFMEEIWGGTAGVPATTYQRVGSYKNGPALEFGYNVGGGGTAVLQSRDIGGTFHKLFLQATEYNFTNGVTAIANFVGDKWSFLKMLIAPDFSTDALTITRQAGKSSLIGTTDLAIDAAGANTLFLNSFGTGDVSIGHGGGNLKYGTFTAGALGGTAGYIAMKADNGDVLRVAVNKQ